MRGDRPRQARRPCVRLRFTPHARGSTLDGLVVELAERVYPACAGIDLVKPEDRASGCGLPRMRGDRPLFYIAVADNDWFTPHARGSTPLKLIIAPWRKVYPACAGIDLARDAGYQVIAGLPRMRGDRPRHGQHSGISDPFTPHARGSTLKSYSLTKT